MKLENMITYQAIDGLMNRFVKGKGNVLLISLPGMGATILTKLWLQKNNKCSYITGAGQELSTKNIIDINPESVEDIELIDSYYKVAKPNTNFLVLISNPGLLTTEHYKNSYFGQHTYLQEFIRVQDRQGTEKLVEYYGGDIAKTSVDKMYKLSGGLGRLIKYLSTKKSDLNFVTLIEDEKVVGMMARVVEAFLLTPKKMLEEMGVVDKNGEVRGQLLAYFLNKHDSRVDIVVGSDLSLIENGEIGNKIARTERDILLKQIQNGGFISREQVAEIKWGKSEFSDFSDQALNKAMRRISDKLKKYKIRTVWKTGYQLEKR